MGLKYFLIKENEMYSLQQLSHIKWLFAQSRCFYKNESTLICIRLVAPAASGKGAFENAKRLAGNYHDQVLKESKKK
jgi:hypothetical protein